MPKTKVKKKVKAKKKNPIIQSKYTVRRHKLFMDKLQETSLLYMACKAAGISKSTAQRWRKEVPGFALEWDDIIDGKMEDLESEIYRRAKDGVTEPVFYQGKQCGTVQKFSDNLATFILRAHRPAKYAGKGVTLDGVGKFSLNINDQDKDIQEGGGS